MNEQAPCLLSLQRGEVKSLIRGFGTMCEYFLLDINEMKRNDLWLNLKGNYVLFVGKILLNLY